MKRLVNILILTLIASISSAQGSLVTDGWIKADLSVHQKANEKLRQTSNSVSENDVKSNVWLESAEGWLKLCYSIQTGTKKTDKAVFQESIPVYDQGAVLWETGKLHRLEGPFYFFEFKIFNISKSQVEGKNTSVSLYYRWVIRLQESLSE